MHSFVLKPGTTGFYDPDQQVQPIDLTLFKQWCYQYARTIGAQTASFDWDLTARSFYICTLHLDKTIYVLLNAAAGYLAFASSVSMDGVQFIEIPSSTDSFIALDPALLCSPITHEALQLLGEGELKQLHYWKPQTMGEVIYNYWD